MSESDQDEEFAEFKKQIQLKNIAKMEYTKKSYLKNLESVFEKDEEEKFDET